MVIMIHEAVCILLIKNVQICRNEEEEDGGLFKRQRGNERRDSMDQLLACLLQRFTFFLLLDYFLLCLFMTFSSCAVLPLELGNERRSEKEEAG